VREANAKDSGNYKIVASNRLGQAVSSSKLTVNEDLTDQDITIIDNLENDSNKSDNTDNDVFEDDYLHISEDSAGSPAQSGNEHEPIKLSIIKPKARKPIQNPFSSGAKPKFLKLFESTTVKESGVLLLSCQVVGEPKPDLFWHKNGREIKSNSRVSITHSANGASSLYIARAIYEDAGVYQITASNEHGIAVYSAEVDIEVPIEYYSEDNVFQVDDKRATKASDENKTFALQKTDSGKSVAQIKCQVKKEDAQVNWLKDEVALPLNIEKYKMIADGKERVLFVDDPHTEDEGEYVCQSGKYRVTLLLTVSEPKKDFSRSTSTHTSDDDDDCELFFQDDRAIRRSQHKRVLSQIKDIYVNDGVKQAAVKCNVKHKETQVEWLRNNQIINSSSKYEMNSSGSERTLVIKSPTRADNGEYVCQSGKHRVALNLFVSPSGRDKSPSIYSSDDDSLFVRNKQVRTATTSTKTTTQTFQFEQSELVFYENQSANLKCKLKRDNEQVVWLKDDKTLWGSDFSLNEEKYGAEQEGSCKTLIIKNLSKQDSGNYACMSKQNPRHRVEFNLKIKEPKVEFIRTLSDVRVTNQNEKVEFECVTKTPRSIDPYKVKWFKDGKEISNESSPRYVMFNYCKDDHLDGSVLNFNKLVIQAPINQLDQGEYTIHVDESLKSSASLLFEPAHNSDVLFKPEIYVKKSSLQGFQNLIPANDESSSYPSNSLSPIMESDQRDSKSQKAQVIKFIKPENDLEFVKQLEPFTNCDEGNDCVLECWTNKFDTSALWFLDNSELALPNRPDKYEISHQDGRKHRLTLKNASPNDTGLYSCHINNYLKTSTLLNINEDVPLRIVDGLHDKHVAEFEKNLQLIVEMNKRVRNDGRTCSIKWFINRREVRSGESDEHELFCIDNKIFLKYLREVVYDRENNAQVECRIQEIKSGLHSLELVTKCRLIVERTRETSRHFTKKLDDLIRADSGLHLDLEARVNFDAELVKWFRNNSELAPNQNYQQGWVIINKLFFLIFFEAS
jgi:hypothetical protein